MTEFSEGTFGKLESLTERNEKCAADVSCKTEDNEKSPDSKDLLASESLDVQIEIDGMKLPENSISSCSKKHGSCEAASDGAETLKRSNDEPAAKKPMICRHTKDPEDVKPFKCSHNTLDDEMSRFYRELEQVSKVDETKAQEGIGLRLVQTEASAMSEQRAPWRWLNSGNEWTKKNLGYQFATKGRGHLLDPYGRWRFSRFGGHLDHLAPAFSGAEHGNTLYRDFCFGPSGHPENFQRFSHPQAACAEGYGHLESVFRQQSHCGWGKGFHSVVGDCHGGDVSQDSKGLHSPLKDKQSYSDWPVKELYLIRGLPGSGKSTLASWLSERGPNGIICSTDDFFRSAEGKYCYDKMRLSEAHFWNQDKAERAMACGRSPVIIDNTNTQAWEMKPYVSQALDLDYHIQFVEPDTWWKTNTEELERRNSHGVDRLHIQSMLSRFDRNVSVDSVLRSKVPIRRSQKAKA
uniref:uncharacterized protein isoform X1 n=2 Tax=Myxine glutinosa TaxID=7769 RepID=UPI00358EABFF